MAIGHSLETSRKMIKAGSKRKKETVEDYIRRRADEDQDQSEGGTASTSAAQPAHEGHRELDPLAAIRRAHLLNEYQRGSGAASSSGAPPAPTNHGERDGEARIRRMEDEDHDQCENGAGLSSDIPPAQGVHGEQETVPPEASGESQAKKSKQSHVPEGCWPS